MEYDKLTPSDWGLISMVSNLTQQDIKPLRNGDSYSISFNFKTTDEAKQRAILEAIEGKAGKRFLFCQKVGQKRIIFIRYSAEALPQYAGPIQYTQPYEGAGLLFCRRLEECRALQVRRDNVEQLILFVGGGELETPKDGPATFHFLNASGSVWAHAQEGDYIVAERAGHFKIVPAAEFEKMWERK